MNEKRDQPCRHYSITYIILINRCPRTSRFTQSTYQFWLLAYSKIIYVPFIPNQMYNLHIIYSIYYV